MLTAKEMKTLALNLTPSCLARQAGSMEVLAGASKQCGSQPVRSIQGTSSETRVSTYFHEPPASSLMSGTQVANTRACAPPSQGCPLKAVLHDFPFPAPPPIQLRHFAIATMIINTLYPEGLFICPLTRIIPFVPTEAWFPEWCTSRSLISGKGRALA